MTNLTFAQFQVVGRKAVLLLNRPPLNILNRAMCAELTSFLLTGFPVDIKDCDGLVIAATGENFCAGADIDEHFPGKVQEMLPAFNIFCRTVAEFPLPTVAVIHGSCMGGGAELARVCRKVIALNPETVYFGVPEIKLGCFPPVGLAVFPRLSQNIMGTIRFLLTGKILKGKDPAHLEEARKMGLINETFSGTLDELIRQLDFAEVVKLSKISSLFGEVLEIDETTVAQALTTVQPQTAKLSTFVLNQATTVLVECAKSSDNLGTALEFAETVYLEEIVPHPDYKEGLTAFNEKRDPRFQKTD